MSTVSVANIHFESTGNNRIQIEGTNTSIYQAGRILMTANSTEMTVNYKNSNRSLVSTLNQQTSLSRPSSVGDLLTEFVNSTSTTPTNYVNTDIALLRSQYPSLSSVVGNSSLDVTNWYNRTTAVGTNILQGVAYGNGVFVAVGNGGVIQTSTDAYTWTSRSTANTNTQSAVTYGNGIFVSVGGAGSIQTSTDGITWTNRARANNNIQRGVAFGNGVYVAVGGNTGDVATIVSSTDGTIWTNRTAANTRIIYDVVYGNGIFVAVGDRASIQTSTDGTTWTNRSPANTGLDLVLSGVTYGGGVFVAVGTDTGGGVEASIQTSTDGTTWANRTPSTQTSLYLTSIAYDSTSNTYVAGGYVIGLSNPSRIQVSTDTITWSAVTPANTNFINHVAYGNGVFVAVGNNGHVQSTLSHEIEFRVYSPYTLSESNLKTFVRASV